MMKKLIVLIALAFTTSSCNFAPGSYPYAEKYSFNVSEDVLIKATEKFKIENPDFITPEYFGLIDGRSKNKTDHWYHIWFYYKKENQVIYTWIRGNEMSFVSINKGEKLGNWERINKDFLNKENKEQKDKFEKLILNKLKMYF